MTGRQVEFMPGRRNRAVRLVRPEYVALEARQ